MTIYEKIHKYVLASHDEAHMLRDFADLGCVHSVRNAFQNLEDAGLVGRLARQVVARINGNGDLLMPGGLKAAAASIRLRRLTEKATSAQWPVTLTWGGQSVSVRPKATGPRGRHGPERMAAIRAMRRIERDRIPA